MKVLVSDVIIIENDLKNGKEKFNWPRRDLNTQPSDLESDALPLRHGVKADELC